MNDSSFSSRFLGKLPGPWDVCRGSAGFREGVLGCLPQHTAMSAGLSSPTSLSSASLQGLQHRRGARTIFLLSLQQAAQAAQEKAPGLCTHHPGAAAQPTSHCHPPTGAEIHSAAHRLCSDGRAHMVPPATVTSHQVPAHASTRLAIAMQSMYTLLQLGAPRPYKTPFCDGISITQRLPCKFSHY